MSTAPNNHLRVEQRQHQRLTMKMSVHFETDEDLFEVTAHDVSPGGVFVRTDRQVERNDRVVIFLIHPQDPDEEIMVQGCVVRHGQDAQGRPGVGVAFNACSARKIERLVEFINSAVDGRQPAAPPQAPAHAASEVA